MKQLRLFLFSLMLVFSFLPVQAQENSSEDPRFQVKTITENLNHPWSIAFLPTGDFLVTERVGRLTKIDAKGVKTPIAGLPGIFVRDQAGLFDVALAPDFKTSGDIYLAYVAVGENGNGLEVVRGKLDLTQNMLSNLRTIFRALPKMTGTKNYGGRLLFASDGTLLISVGDHFEMNAAQNLGNDLGKVIRINTDGSIPSDNPFRNNPKARPEIYTYGNRNVEGMTLRPGTTEIWVHEHGPKGGDEVNILKSGANYGWPLITYGVDYSGAIITSKTAAPGMEQPVTYWVPSIAPSGMTFYAGDKFPAWKGNLFVGTLVGQHLRRLDVQGNRIVAQEILLGNVGQRIRDVRTGPDGYIYVLTDEDQGQLARLEPMEKK